MIATATADASRTPAGSLEQNGLEQVSPVYTERVIPGPPVLFTALWKNSTPADGHVGPKRVLPDLCADFIADSDGNAWLVGPATRADLVTCTPGTTLWGVRINPPALRAVLGVEAATVQDLKIALDDILTSRQARLLADALRTRTLDAATIGALWPSTEPEPEVTRNYRALVASPTTAVRDIAADLGISERHFRRITSASVGLSPKFIQKVQRMQNVLALSRVDNSALAALAGQAGYADQAHLARDAQALAGITPTRLLREHR